MIKSMSDLVKDLQELARDWRASLDQSDAANANRLFGKIVEVFRELRDRSGGEYAEVLVRMTELDDQDLSVFACGELLFESPREAVTVLEGVASGTGDAAFSASMVLSEWRAGSFRRLT
jgi:hypothetical protein